MADIERIIDQAHPKGSPHFHALAEHSAVGIWHIDLLGATLYINPAMRRMLQLDDSDPADDLVANPARLVYEFCTPQSRLRMRTEHQKRTQGQPSTYEVELVGKRGRHCNALVCGAPVLGADGVLSGMIATFTDITENKRVEAVLRQHEMQLRLLGEQVPAILWTTDLALRFTSSLGGGLAGTGMRAGQAVGLSVPQFFEGDKKPDAPAIEAHRRALLGLSSTYEQVWSGHVYFSHVEPLRSPSGAIGGVIGVALDVTERKKAENDLRDARDWLEFRVQQRTLDMTRVNEALRGEVKERRAIEEQLRQSQARYASILNSQQTLVSRSDPHGRITYVNEAHRLTFDSKEGDNVFVDVHPDDIESTRLAMQELSKPPHTCTLEQRCQVRGNWRTFLWQVGVIRDRRGQLVEYQGVGFDITGLKQAQEMLRDTTRLANKSAEEARAAARRERQAARRERRAAEEARQVADFNRRLAQEVDHRVRNNLAGLLNLVTAMRDTARDVPSFASAIEGRLLAMSHTHKILADSGWQSVDLRALIISLLSAVERLCPNRISPQMQGPPISASPRQARALSMVLVEWFNNSCKYGAHSVADGGALSISWEIVDAPAAAPSDASPAAIDLDAATRDEPSAETSGTAAAATRQGAARRIRLRWTESGGPPPCDPIRPSLGTQLVRGFVSVELHGTCELHYLPRGADHLLEFPMDEARTRVAGGGI